MLLSSFIVFCVILFGIVITFNIIQRKKVKKVLRNQWGKLNTFSNTDSVYSLEDNLEFAKQCQLLDASFINRQTWNDLNLLELFEKIDISKSSLGAEYLYTKLHQQSYCVDTEFEDMKVYLRNNSQDRLDIQCNFAGLGKKNNNLVGKFILESKQQKEKLLWLYFFLGALPLLSAFVALFFQLFGSLLFLFSILFNIGFSLSKKYFLDTELERMSYLVQMLCVGGNLSKYNFPQHSVLRECVRNFSLLKIIGYAFVPNMETSDASVIFEYINYIFLIPMISYAYALNKLKHHSEEAKKVYDILGKLEAAISVLNYQETVEYFCVPTFVDEKVIFGKEIYHPLIKDPVMNSIEFRGNILISGDNASGKSTFLRTIALNMILAQSLNIAMAKEFKMSYGNVMAIINIQDDLDKGESYFMAESKAIKSIIETANSYNQNYIFLDELFKGTNTIERVAAGLGVMKWLNKNNCFYLISTHDVELVEQGSKWNTNYHFTSDFIDNKIYYDYKIRPGKAKTSNAINVLKTLDYPIEIVDFAQSLINNMEKTES